MSTKRKPNSKSPIRAALAQKKALRTWHDVAVEETEIVDARQRDVDVARQLVAATLLHEDESIVERAKAKLAEAEAARDACFYRIYFRGLSLTEFDALVELHPPTDEQAADGWLWNPETFDFALLEHCALDSDLTADEWREELADGEKWSRADVTAVKSMCLTANRQTMSDAIPKG